jgi:uncharacterized HhH-GPD family protein
MLASDTTGRVHAGLVGEGNEYPRHGPAVRRRKVDVALHRREDQLGTIIVDVEQPLQVGGLPHEPVKVVHDHPVKLTGAEVREQSLKLRTHDPALKGRDVVIPVEVGDPPIASIGQAGAVLLLTINAPAHALGVLADSYVGCDPMTQSKTPFTGDPEADRLLSTNPFALLCGMLLDQQVPMDWAFRGPLELKRRLGALDPATLAAMDPEAVVAVFVDKPALHRYPASMARRVHELATFLVERYDGQADRVWKGVKDPAVLLERLQELPGYGKQKAQIFLAIIGKRLGAAPPGWEELAGAYGQPGHRSIADVDGPGAVDKVRAYKQEMKRKAKAASA